MLFRSPHQWQTCDAVKNFSVLHEGEQGKKGYTLSFIEFDDFGEFYSRCQLDNAGNAISQAKAAAKPAPAIVAIFVHGWKNNASDRTGNVWGFRDALRDIATHARAESPVIGVHRMARSGGGFSGRKKNSPFGAGAIPRRMSPERT